MKGIEIAKAYGVTPAYISKWSPERKAEAIRNLQSGVNPIIAELVGELQRECYVASRYIENAIQFEFDSYDEFNVHIVDETYIVQSAPLNPYELQGAIVKVKELYKND